MKYLLILALLFLLYQMIRAGIRNSSIRSELRGDDEGNRRGTRDESRTDYGTIKDARFRDVDQQ